MEKKKKKYVYRIDPSAGLKKIISIIKYMYMIFFFFLVINELINSVLEYEDNDPENGGLGI